jgi:hypothetical protein
MQGGVPALLNEYEKPVFELALAYLGQREAAPAAGQSAHSHTNVGTAPALYARRRRPPGEYRSFAPHPSRPAIVLDWKPEGQEYISGESVFIRYWVGALTGTTLRQQIFIQNDDPVLLMDFFAQQAFFDIDLPAAVFNPFQAIYLGISKDYLATPIDPKALKAQAEKMKQLANVPGHEQYERREPPPGFDPAEAALSLAWSPDGKELALITVLNQQYTALVAEVETGEIIYSVPIETVFVWDAADKPVDWPANDWPGHAWGIQFPARMKGLDGCYWP